MVRLTRGKFLVGAYHWGDAFFFKIGATVGKTLRLCRHAVVSGRVPRQGRKCAKTQTSQIPTDQIKL